MDTSKIRKNWFQFNNNNNNNNGARGSVVG
jgi:hypothetical protein